ncbi:hypothetical protein BPT24_152 [Tenacibaculum phage pT24]|uniref:Uncharacterized protein n=1 Tax=Tenacibaculum phage pT24 TaxID=1880590 RepID=A0A1B4XWV1_9CAUD|nr:hypothetical protein HYP10_gp152 [Tenacibaculum phage pT24]BAV39278.1 hypothetical protein BPT24_152 [Tenacibaculum phage pT24]
METIFEKIEDLKRQISDKEDLLETLKKLFKEENPFFQDNYDLRELYNSDTIIFESYLKTFVDLVSKDYTPSRDSFYVQTFGSCFPRHEPRNRTSDISKNYITFEIGQSTMYERVAYGRTYEEIVKFITLQTRPIREIWVKCLNRKSDFNFSLEEFKKLLIDGDSKTLEYFNEFIEYKSLPLHSILDVDYEFNIFIAYYEQRN